MGFPEYNKTARASDLTVYSSARENRAAVNSEQTVRAG
jgi:hypothetical protein